MASYTSALTKEERLLGQVYDEIDEIDEEILALLKKKRGLMEQLQFLTDYIEQKGRMV